MGLWREVFCMGPKDTGISMPEPLPEWVKNWYASNERVDAHAKATICPNMYCFGSVYLGKKCGGDVAQHRFLRCNTPKKGPHDPNCEYQKSCSPTCAESRRHVAHELKWIALENRPQWQKDREDALAYRRHMKYCKKPF